MGKKTNQIPALSLSVFLLFLHSELVAESPILSAKQQKKATVAQIAPEHPSLLQEECSEGRWKTEVSFLYWQGSEDGLEFAAKNDPRFLLSSDIPTDIDANLLALDFSWEPAFKAFFGYHFPKAGWDLGARWTYFHSKSQQSANAPLSDAGAGLFPIWIPQQAAIAPFPVYNHAKASFFLHCNMIDFEYAYTGGLSQFLYLKLHAGLKAIFINQLLHAAYQDGFSGVTGTMITSHAQAKSNTWGLGPRIGFGSRWELPKGFSLIAEAAAAFALSQIDTKRKDFSVGSVSGLFQDLTIHVEESFWVWRPLVESKIGFQWAWCFSQYRRLSLEAAYEAQHYWEQNMMTRYADQPAFYSLFNVRGNLILQGLSLTASLEY